MILWRISRHRNLSGLGGLVTNGRWHDAGDPVVYFSESPAAALLEICAHTTANDVPVDFTLLQIEAPDVPISAVTEAELPKDWRKNFASTRKRGTDWLRSKSGVLLRVPSAIVPHTSNFLFNPAHPDAAQFQITEIMTYPFDLRIKQ